MNEEIRINIIRMVGERLRRMSLGATRNAPKTSSSSRKTAAVLKYVFSPKGRAR